MSRLSRRQLTLLLPSAAAFPADAPEWELAHEFAGRVNALAVSDTGWPAAAGIRATRGVLLAGPNWQSVETPEPFHSLAVRGDGAILLACGPTGVWRASQGGKLWDRVETADGFTRVYLRDEYLGYALGSNKIILETTDAGGSWAPLDAASQPSSTPEFTTYHWADFASPLMGVITGVSRPPRDGRTETYPYWLDPEPGTRRKEWPSASITLETRDGGRNWKASSTSVFGRLTRVRYTRGGFGLALVEFHDQFEYPSEVFSIDLRKGGTERAFRRKDRAVTDLVLSSPRNAILAAIEPPALPAEESRGALHLLISEDCKDWREMSLPKPLTGQRAFLGAGDRGAVWAATDSGAFLRLRSNSVESR